MRIDLYKVTQSREPYLGVIEQDNAPSKGDVIHFLGHDYKVIHIERGSSGGGTRDIQVINDFLL